MISYIVAVALKKSSVRVGKIEHNGTVVLKIYHFFAENEFFWLLLRTIYV